MCRAFSRFEIRRRERGDHASREAHDAQEFEHQYDLIRTHGAPVCREQAFLAIG
jgi:hypothetical protein